MKIIHVEMGRHLYGGALQVLYLMEGLGKHNHHSILVCPEGSKIQERASNIAKVYPIPIKGELDSRALVWLVRIIRRENPDLIHVHSRRGADWWGGMAARMCRVKGILSRRIDNPENSLAVRLKYPLFDRVVVISRAIKKVLESCGVPPEKISYIPSGVRVSDFARPCDRKWFLEEFRLKPENKTIAVIAQMIPRKGHIYLIEAAAEILRYNDKVRFLLFGKGPLFGKLQALCKSAGIMEGFHFAGYRDDIPRILPCVDVVAHPAYMEGLGLALLQSAAAGRPIVACAVGGIPEIVKDGYNGYLVPSRNSRELAKAIKKLLDDPEKAKLFGEAGRRLVVERFSVEGMVEGNLRLYHRLLDGG